MAWENMNGEMVRPTKVNGAKIRFMGSEFTNGQMGDVIMENGKTIR